MVDDIEQATHMESVLRSTTDVAIQNSAEMVKAVKNETPEPVVPRVKPARKKSFSINYVGQDGVVYAGSFTNQILTIGLRSQVGIVQARLSGGQPYETLDFFTRRLNEMVAHLTFSLVEKPDWFVDIAGIYDIDLLQAVMKEVDLHEETFRKLDPAS